MRLKQKLYPITMHVIVVLSMFVTLPLLAQPSKGLSFDGSTITGKLTQGEEATGLRISVPYTGGNGGPHFGQSAISTGVTGLTLTLPQGQFAQGPGKLEYVLSGRPQQAGRAGFELKIGGQGCVLTVGVQAKVSPGPGPGPGTESQQTYTDPIVGKYIFVQGGTFDMGCTSEQKDCFDREKPVHRVTLSDYYMGETEVTQAQWRAVMGDNPSYFKNCDQCPVESGKLGRCTGIHQQTERNE
jgi:formylglycine-generating enzyme required for sulfatase activity